MNIGKGFLTDQKFSQIWKELETELYKLYNKSKCSGLTIYNNIYRVCTSASTRYVEDLYWKLGDFLYEQLRHSRHTIYQSQDWVLEYNIQFHKYKEYIESVNELVDYLNQYITTKSMHHFAFLLWERCILQPAEKYKETTLGQYLVTYEDKEQVYQVIKSFRSILVDPKQPLLYYAERYEQYALNDIKTRYENFIQSYDFLSVTEYTKLINQFVLEERHTRKQTLLEESWPKLDLILEDILVIRKKKYLRNEIYKVLCRHKLPIEVMNYIRNSGSRSAGKEDNKKNTEEEQFMDYTMTMRPLSTHHTPATSHATKFIHPVKDYHTLYDNQFSSVHTFSSDILEEVNQISSNLEVTESGKKILDFVLVKYLDTEINMHKHLLDRKIETLYTFYNMFEKVVQIAFKYSESAKDTLNQKCRVIFNSLAPPLSSRLLKFSTEIVTEENCELASRTCKKEEGIDFYDKKDEFINMNSQEEGIIVSDLTISKYKSKYDGELRTMKHFKYKNSSLPDLSRDIDKMSYQDGALLRVYSCLYDLVDDKVEFIRVYLHELCKRILLKRTNYEKELKLYEIIKQRCNNREIITRGEMILMDMKKMYMKMSGVHFVSLSTWLLDTERQRLVWPEPLRKLMVDNIKDKNEKHVFWSFEYSTVEVEIFGIVYKMNLLQYLIIDLYNKYGSLTRNIIQEETGMFGYVLESAISSLIRSALIKEAGCYTLDCHADNQNVVDYYIKEIKYDAIHEYDKEACLQGQICRIMKRNKFLGMVEIQHELAKEVISGYISEEIYQALDSCMQKGILDYRDGRYVYIP